MAFASSFVAPRVRSSKAAVCSATKTRSFSAFHASLESTWGSDSSLQFHNEGSTWSGMGDVWVSLGGGESTYLEGEGDEDDTVQYGEKTVFTADLCDTTGEGCGPEGEIPEDATRRIPTKPTPTQETEGQARGFVEYSRHSSVFLDDDTIPQK